MTNPAGVIPEYRSAPMPELDEAGKRAAGLYWLAFLLTGDVEKSTSVALKVIDEDAFPRQMEEARRMAIVQALAAIRSELRASSQRPERERNEGFPIAACAGIGDGQMTSARVEAALLGMDAFPRCVLVMRVLEGISIEETATLLGPDQALVRDAQVLGLQRLAGSIGARSLQNTKTVNKASALARSFPPLLSKSDPSA